jgi:Na+/proline symporter
MFVGALAAGAVLLSRLWPDVSAPAEHVKIFDLSPTVTGKNPTLWGGILGGTFITLATHGCDQDIVQRLLTAKDVRSSRRALIASGFLDIPIVVIFLSIGTLLRLYFARHLDPAAPTKPNEVFPYFIAHDLPRGLAGLVIAGVLSVVMGSLSAAMNALASTAVLDVWKPRLGVDAKPEGDLLAARFATFVFAVLLTVVAVVSSLYRETNLIDLALGSAGLTFGALLGVFLRGFLTKGAGDRANVVAMVASVGAMAAIKAFTTMHWNWYVPIGAAIAFGVGAIFAELERLGRAPGA